jgi:uncharacterized membrane protein YphA (DoxX/SURF4 family)
MLPGGPSLRKLLSSFPGGRAGAGLLLLRISVGYCAALAGISMLVGADARTTWQVAAGWAGAVAGSALMLGILTPVAGIAEAVLCLCGLIASGVHPNHEVLRHLEPALLSLAICLLGPGAFSLDALFFGRREIVIPAAPRRPHDGG